MPPAATATTQVEQIPTAQVIHRLRELDVPLSDVQRILRSPDPDQRAALVAEHLGRLESELARTRAAVISLRRLLAPEPAPLQVELRAEPAVTVAAVEDEVGEGDVEVWYAGAMAELDAALGPTPERTDRPAASMTTRCFETRTRTPAALPARPRAAHTVGASTRFTLPAVELVVTTHQGEHDGIDVTYGELGSWVIRQRANGGRTGAGALPRRPARHRRQRRVAHRDRVAGVSRSHQSLSNWRKQVRCPDLVIYLPICSDLGKDAPLAHAGPRWGLLLPNPARGWRASFAMHLCIISRQRRPPNMA